MAAKTSGRKQESHAAFKDNAKEMASKEMPELIEFWKEVYKNPLEKTADRMRASENIAAYGVGKPAAEPPRKPEATKPMLSTGLPTENDLADADTDLSEEIEEESDDDDAAN